MKIPKKFRRGWIAVRTEDYGGQQIEEPTRVYFTKPAAERHAARIGKGPCFGNEVIELWVPR